jgi:2-oxoisovalerate dehydrogenase E1 component beta subunit
MSNMVQAIRMALHVAEERHGLTDVFGEDVGPPLGGAFTATQGVKSSWNAPLDERGIVGASIGLGLAGCRNVAEIQFCDYAFNTIDLLKLAGMMSWASAGDWNCPITIMTPVGSGIRGSIYHSHSFDAMATHIHGFKIAIPSTPREAYGLLLSCIVDPNPCFFLVPKALMRTRSAPGEEIPGIDVDDRALSKMIDAPLGDRSKWQAQWPDTPDLFIPFGEGRTVREGRDLTVVSYGRTLPLCAKAADELAAQSEGRIQAEVIDLRSLFPIDWQRIKESVSRTGRVLFVNEDTEVTNFGEHLVRRTCDELFYRLLAPPRLLAGAPIPGIGLADALEMASVPQLPSILAAMRELATTEP